jgi:hypothetical protein
VEAGGGAMSSEVFVMITRVFAPRDRLVRELTAWLHAWAEQYFEKLRIGDIVSALPEEVRADLQVDPSRTARDILRDAVRIAELTPEHLYHLFASITLTLYPHLTPTRPALRTSVAETTL